MIPEFVFEPRAIYCDCDLLFMLDICELYTQDLAGYSIGASATQTRC